MYKMQTNYQKAEPLFLQALGITERTLGLSHPHVINRYKNLAELYERMGQVDKAEKTWATQRERKALREKELAQ